MKKIGLFIIVLQVISLSVSAQDISSVNNTSEPAEKGNFTETVAALILLAPSSVPNGPYTGTEGTAVSFDGSKSFNSDGSIKSYSWNFGDGNSSNLKNPTHIYIQNGTYNVSLEVTDNSGLNATNTTTAIIADKKPQADFIGASLFGMELLNVTFTD